MNADGSGETEVTPGGNDESDPSWSPDGTQIVFVGFPAGGGSRDIFTMSADGLTRVPLTSTEGSEFTPEWQPLPICTVSGTAEADNLVGTEGNDVLCGRGGDDAISGAGGVDLVIGGPGNDTLLGDDANDMLDGGPGSDSLFGGSGFDSLNGGPGTDVCSVDDGGGFTLRCP